ncbi:MAG: hypothetical protein IT385_21935 [Deltaproteobacteria bacterium]|nr:hypothetical protein [Deltaproteobacteria bacterium]
MKFYRHLVTAGALGALAVIPACSDEQGPSSDGAGIELKIGAINYPKVMDTCWGFAIHNPAGQLVVKQEGICASDYGNDAGGDFAYVAPCDGSQTGMSTVTLWLEGIQTGVDGDGDPVFEDEDNYINPCGLELKTLETDNLSPIDEDDFPTLADINFDGTFCQQQVQCVPNADRPVIFNLTIMRDAKQGFFDVVVDFQDIFCSAKVDQCYSNNGKPIELLFDMDTNDPDAGPRDPTSVMALACTAGPDIDDEDDETTTLHYSRVRLRCERGTNPTVVHIIPLDPTGAGSGAGNQVATQAFLSDSTAVSGFLPVNFALYWGKEELPCGYIDETPDDPDDPLTPVSCNKKYWNIAVNLEDLQENGYSKCSLIAQATATGVDGVQLVNGQLTGDGVTYAAIDYNEDVLLNGAPACDWNPLNGENKDGAASAVQTNYYGTGDLIGIEPLDVMCYNKNTKDDGEPNYTDFVDKYVGYSMQNDIAYMDAYKAGRLGADYKGRIGGDHRANCFKAREDVYTAVLNTKEAAEWTVPAGTVGANFALVGVREQDFAQLNRIDVNFYAKGAAGWLKLGEGTKVTLDMLRSADGYGVNNIAGATDIAINLVDTRIGKDSQALALTFQTKAIRSVQGTPQE